MEERRASKEEATGYKPPISYLESLMHLLKGYIGTGIFALGDAFGKSGLVLGPILLLFIAFLNLICQHKIISCAKLASENLEYNVTYGDAVEYAVLNASEGWRKRAKCLATSCNWMIWSAEIGFCCVYFVFIAAHINQIIAAYDIFINVRVMLAIILGPLALTVLMNSLKFLVPSSVAANILMLAGVIIIFYVTSFGAGPIEDRQLFVQNIEKIPLFFGITLFAFEGITFVAIIPLRNEMRKPEGFERLYGVLNIGIIFVVILYVCVGWMAYYKYGEEIEGSVFLNFEDKDVFAQVVKGMMSVAVLFTFTLHMYLLCEMTFPEIHKKWGPFKHQTLILNLYKLSLVLFAYIAANVIPYLGLFISLVGSITGAFLALIIPPWVEMLAFRQTITKLRFTIDILIMSLGFLALITGTTVSMYEIIQSIRKDLE